MDIKEIFSLKMGRDKQGIQNKEMRNARPDPQATIHDPRFTIHGFTMIEILTVAAIIVLLAAILLPAVGKARERAYISKAQATISAVETAVSMYESDFGYYPGVNQATAANFGTNTGMSSMMVNILSSYTLYNSFTKWQGPYMEFKSEDLSGTSPTAKLIDPWGNMYNYQVNGASKSPRLRIWSNGPDAGNDSSSNPPTPADDDIGNW